MSESTHWTRIVSQRDVEISQLRAELSAARRTALEEAARVAEQYRSNEPERVDNIGYRMNIAWRIRALINAAPQVVPVANGDHRPKTGTAPPAGAAPNTASVPDNTFDVPLPEIKMCGADMPLPPPAVPDVTELPPEPGGAWFTWPDNGNRQEWITRYDYDNLRAVAERLREQFINALAINETLSKMRNDEYERAERAEQDLSACRELLSMHNMGGMTDYNDGPMKRALKAEAECERLRVELQKLSPRLYSDMERT